METNSIIKYLRKEIEKYTKLSEKLEYMYENERDGHPVDMYEDDRYIEYSVKINYINRLVDKIKKGQVLAYPFLCCFNKQKEDICIDVLTVEH